jgi:hypothetical protein
VICHEEIGQRKTGRHHPAGGVRHPGDIHLLVLLGLLPSNIVWGGQAADSPARLLTLELVAVLATVLFGVVIAVKAGYIRAGRLQILASTVYGSSLPTFCSILPGTSHLERGSRT